MNSLHKKRTCLSYLVGKSNSFRFTTCWATSFAKVSFSLPIVCLSSKSPTCTPLVSWSTTVRSSPVFVSKSTNSCNTIHWQSLALSWWPPEKSVIFKKSGQMSLSLWLVTVSANLKSESVWSTLSPTTTRSAAQSPTRKPLLPNTLPQSKRRLSAQLSKLQSQLKRNQDPSWTTAATRVKNRQLRRRYQHQWAVSRLVALLVKPIPRMSQWSTKIQRMKQWWPQQRTRCQGPRPAPTSWNLPTTSSRLKSVPRATQPLAYRDQWLSKTYHLLRRRTLDLWNQLSQGLIHSQLRRPIPWLSRTHQCIWRATH